MQRFVCVNLPQGLPRSIPSASSLQPGVVNVEQESELCAELRQDIQYTIYNIFYTMYNIQYTRCNVQYAMYIRLQDAQLPQGPYGPQGGLGAPRAHVDHSDVQINNSKFLSVVWTPKEGTIARQYN